MYGLKIRADALVEMELYQKMIKSIKKEMEQDGVKLLWSFWLTFSVEYDSSFSC